MDIQLRDLLKHSFVITIDDSKFSSFKKVFKFHGLSPMPRRFDGVRLWYNSPQYNCYLAHRNAILAAKKRKWPYVCVFEDDAWPVVGVKEELEKYLAEVPDNCKVLSLGNICMLSNLGMEGEFLKGIRVYGSQAYVVFANAYDDYVRQLDLRPEGDGAIDNFDDHILGREFFYTPRRNLFIQYNETNSTNNHSGYVLYKPIHDAATGLIYISNEKRISTDEAVSMGFPAWETVFNAK